jgi:hypothetical protein
VDKHFSFKIWLRSFTGFVKADRLPRRRLTIQNEGEKGRIGGSQGNQKCAIHPFLSFPPLFWFADNFLSKNTNFDTIKNEWVWVVFSGE